MTVLPTTDPLWGDVPKRYASPNLVAAGVRSIAER
jgi:hypothetical protein